MIQTNTVVDRLKELYPGMTFEIGKSVYTMLLSTGNIRHSFSYDNNSCFIQKKKKSITIYYIVFIFYHLFLVLIQHEHV